LRAWPHWQAKGEIDLWYYDESGVQLNPNGLYAWQGPGLQATLPAQGGNVLTVAGFLTTDNGFEGYYHQGAMDAELFIAYFDDFIGQRVRKKTGVVMDRASFHTAHQVQEKIKQWQAQNVFIQLLPAYSSELNLIEHLWRLVKHHCLPIWAWQSAQQLTQQGLDILKNIGTTYRIDFTGP
jgi:transposase